MSDSFPSTVCICTRAPEVLNDCLNPRFTQTIAKYICTMSTGTLEGHMGERITRGRPCESLLHWMPTKDEYKGLKTQPADRKVGANGNQDLLPGRELKKRKRRRRRRRSPLEASKPWLISCLIRLLLFYYYRYCIAITLFNCESIFP